MKSLAVFVFPGIQTLDLFGPIELIGGFDDKISLSIVAQSLEPVPTRHGQRILPDKSIADGTEYDMLLVPGGDSALDVPNNPEAMHWLLHGLFRSLASMGHLGTIYRTFLFELWPTTAIVAFHQDWSWPGMIVTS